MRYTTSRESLKTFAFVTTLARNRHPTSFIDIYNSNDLLFLAPSSIITPPTSSISSTLSLSLDHLHNYRCHYQANNIMSLASSSSNNADSHDVNQVIAVESAESKPSISVTTEDTSSSAATTTSTTTGASIKTSKSKPSFFRRKLPTDTCIALSSKNGQKIFQSCMESGGLKCFFSLIEQHSTQSEPSFCGITTLVVALNAMTIDPYQNWNNSPWRWYDETMLNCCISLNEVKKTGITMNVFQCLAICQGLQTKLYYINEHGNSHNYRIKNNNNDDDEPDSSSKNKNDVSLETFRNIVKQVCVEDKEQNENQNYTCDVVVGGGENVEDDSLSNNLQIPLRNVLVVSYDRKVLNQTGSGHFSPIAAYDSKTDHVLIMDTARFKYGVHWVQLSKLYDAMVPVDPDTNKSRGFVILTNNNPNPEHNTIKNVHKKGTNQIMSNNEIEKHHK